MIPGIIAQRGGISGGPPPPPPPPPVLWTPAEITTALWLDAADSETITLISSAVSQWDDKSGNARHVLQSATPSLRPAVNAAAQNGLDTLAFNGDMLETSGNFPLTGNAEFSIFVAYRKGATASAGCVLGWGNHGVALNAVGLYDDGTGRAWAYAGGSGYFINAVGVSTNYIMGYTKRAGAINTTSAAWRNGVDDGTSGHSGTTPNIAAQPFRVGQWSSFTSNRLIGDVFEIIVLPVEATEATRQRIEGRLAHKWGLTAGLAGDHPYKTTPPYV